ncbi:MAG: potassium/proton antiporter [Xenococcaceae cyanobacterium MO_207.B15]|nr:potassium/proton antiporter [Xenococcaceae cyanobacterium MO_207.B15]
MVIEKIFIVIGILLLLSIISCKVSIKLGIPALLLFMTVGMLAGSEGIGGIEFDDPLLAKSIGDLALTLILFSGGLDTQWRQIRPVLWKGLTLSTLGVVITMLLLGSFAWFLLGSFSSFDIGTKGITWLEGLLLGAIVSSTDAAAVFATLRSSNLVLKGNLQPLLELESGSNDPMALLLTTSIIGILTTSDASIINLGLSLIQQLFFGSVFGYGFGLGAVWVINHLRLPSQGLYPIASLALALLTFGATAVFSGNGFLAVYIAGLVLGNRPLVNKEIILSFHDALAWLMQIAMFLILGLLVFPSQLLPFAGVAVTMSLFLMFVARPLSIFLCLVGNQVSFREKLFISWVGLRGSVPIILATFPVIAGIAQADRIFNLVFFLVLTSVLIQGLSLAMVARWLGLAESQVIVH